VDYYGTIENELVLYTDLFSKGKFSSKWTDGNAQPCTQGSLCAGRVLKEREPWVKENQRASHSTMALGMRLIKE
jgi:hypothetical protein